MQQVSAPLAELARPFPKNNSGQQERQLGNVHHRPREASNDQQDGRRRAVHPITKRKRVLRAAEWPDADVFRADLELL